MGEKEFGVMKTNLAELLKDCPKGMELDCTMYDNVQLDYVLEENIYPIKVQTPEGQISLNKYGCYSNNKHAKCVIFPKGKKTWEGFVPPCKFKEGDVISIMINKSLWYGIYQKEFNTKLYCYVDYSDSTQKLYPSNDNGTCLIDDIVEMRLATEEEKKKLFDAIKANGYKWNAETKTLEKLVQPIFKKGDKVRVKNGVSEPRIIDGVFDTFYSLQMFGKIDFTDQDNWELAPNKFDITTLKPFDKVLVRNTNTEYWRISLFGAIVHDDIRYFMCLANSGFYQCVPYEHNEHLLGTTNDCDDFYKTWEK